MSPRHRPLSSPAERRSLRPLLSLALLLSSLAGCASLPPPADPAAHERPATWARSGDLPPQAVDPARLARWWRQFDDADLDLLVRLALAQNSDLAIARATLRQAQAVRGAAESGTRPSLSASAGSSRQRQAGTVTSMHQLGLSASWEPDLNGAQGAALDAAEADLQAAAADLDSTRMSLVAEVGIAYVQWRDAQARERLQQSAALSLAQTLELTRWRAQAGLDSALALEQARLAAEQARAQLPGLATEIAQYEHQLAWLTGQTAPGLIAQLAHRADPPDDRAALQSLALGVPADLLRRRPDLRSAEAAVRAQWSRRDQTRREGWPGLNLSGSLSLQAATLAALGSGGTGVAALAASITGPLWDGGQRQALVEQQDALLEQARWRYEGSVRSALTDVEDALVALHGSLAQADALARAADAAGHVFQLTQHQRSAGLVGVSELLDAQRNADSAELSLQAARSTRTLNLIRLFKALGGGWEPTDSSTATATADPTHTPAAAAPTPVPPALRP